MTEEEIKKEKNDIEEEKTMSKAERRKKDQLSIQGGGGTFEDKYVSGRSIGGRVGYTKELDNDSSVTGGMSGYSSSVKVDTPEGMKKFKNSKVTGVDLSYKKDDSEYGVDVQKQGKGNKVFLRYSKNFAKGGVVKANCGASVPPTQKFNK